MPDVTIAAIGCSGPIGHHFIEGLLGCDVNVRVLARTPDAVRAAFPTPTVQVVEGSLLDPNDVARVVDGADAVLAVTPMGVRNDPSSEIAAGRSIAAGAVAGGAKHVVYNSVLGADTARGVGILDAKHEIEPLLQASGVPVSILRCGTFFEDIFDPRLAQLRKGRFVFPISRHRRFTYTCQHDIAPFVTDVLVRGDIVLDEPINFVSPGTYSLADVETVLSAAAGRPIKTAPKFPAYHLIQAAGPILKLRGGRFSSIVPLLRWFEHHGYTDPGPTVGQRFPDFPTTTIEQYTSALFARSPRD